VPDPVAPPPPPLDPPAPVVDVGVPPPPLPPEPLVVALVGLPELPLVVIEVLAELEPAEPPVELPDVLPVGAPPPSSVQPAKVKKSAAQVVEMTSFMGILSSDPEVFSHASGFVQRRSAPRDEAGAMPPARARSFPRHGRHVIRGRIDWSGPPPVL